MPNQYANTWPREDTLKLIQLWNMGRSAKEVATALHRTRNQVLGKIFRLRLNPPHDYPPVTRSKTPC